MSQLSTPTSSLFTVAWTLLMSLSDAKAVVSSAKWTKRIGFVDIYMSLIYKRKSTGPRFGKSTHISMISNTVTHLRSYTNSAIAGNSAPISPVTPQDRRRLRIEHQYRRIEWPPCDRWRRCTKCRRLHIECRCLCTTIGVASIGDPTNLIVIVYFTASIGSPLASVTRRYRRRDRRYRRERDPILNSVLNGHWSNSVHGRKIPEGKSGPNTEPCGTPNVMFDIEEL